MTSELRQAAEVNIGNLKPFRLLKFFSFSGLFVFLISTSILVWEISNHTKKMLIDRSDAYALVLAENLNHQVFLQFVIPTLMSYGEIKLRNEKQFERLDTIVQNTIHGMSVKSVTIFDSEKNIVSYSTMRELVGQKGYGEEEYQKALVGKSNYNLILRGSVFNLLPGARKISCLLKTYSPFRQEQALGQSTGQVMGVFEIVQDLSADFEALFRLQAAIVGTAIVIMSGLFVVLWFIVARADRIIEARAVERRQLEEKLHHVQRLAGLGEMVASVSHEIKNPLGIVRSTAEMLGRRLRKVAPGNDHLANVIVEETVRLDGIVTEFLDFARPQTPNFSPLQLKEVLMKALTFMAPELEKRKIEVTTSWEEGLPLLAGDQNLLYRAFLNILMNGVQAMAEGGTLTVASSRATGKGYTQEVRISDTGIGMSPELRQQIFEPFFTNKNRGTGLGLAIVKNIVDVHHGRIKVTSVEGRGTTFRIEF